MLKFRVYRWMEPSEQGILHRVIGHQVPGHMPPQVIEYTQSKRLDVVSWNKNKDKGAEGLRQQ